MGRFLSFSQNLPIWDAEARRAELLSGVSQASRLSAYPLPTGGLAVKKVLGVGVELGEQGGAGLGGVGATHLAEHIGGVDGVGRAAIGTAQGFGGHVGRVRLGEQAVGWHEGRGLAHLVGALEGERPPKAM